MSHLARIRDLDDKLIRFDLAQFRNLKQAFRRLSPEQQAECQRQLAEERQKLGVEKTLQELVDRAGTYAAAFEQSLDNICQRLESGQVEEAEAEVQQALAQERGAEKLIEDIQTQEKALVHLLTKQVAQLETAARK